MTVTEIDKETTLTNAKAIIGTCRPPNVLMVKGEGPYLWDIDGKKYIDFFAGIAVNSLGHCEPGITKIIMEQSSQLLHSSMACPTPWPYALASKLVEKTKAFGGMYNASNVFLCSSGTEANEAALKFARKYGKSISPDKTEIICFTTSFHGRTFGSLSVTSNPKYQAPFTPLVPGVKTATVGDIKSVEELISEKTCAVIIEPLQGEGGIRPVDHDFLLGVKKLCQKNKAALIYDEVQCGMGRSGSLWVHAKLPKEAHPDIFTSAKALGNGFPIGACIVSKEINSVLKPGDHGSTFGGHPVAARIGCYVLDTIADETFLKNVQKKSDLLKSKLSELKTKYPGKITDIRGEGLMLGMEVGEEAKAVVDKARDLGLCTIAVAGNVIRFLPPLNIPDEVLVDGVEILGRAFASVFSE